MEDGPPQGIIEEAMLYSWRMGQWLLGTVGGVGYQMQEEPFHSVGNGL